MFCCDICRKRKASGNTFSRGEGGPPERSEEAAGRKRNAGDKVDRYEMCQSFASVGFYPSKPGSKYHRYSVSSDFRPNSSSVGAADSFPPGEAIGGDRSVLLLIVTEKHSPDSSRGAH